MADDSLRSHFEDFLNATVLERERAERRRDYRDLKQWTETEVKKLEQRNQAPIVFDQFGKKVDAICGIEINRRSDPKAYPLMPKHEKAADAVTDSMRFVELHTNLDETASEVFEDKIVEGYGGAIVEVAKEGDEFKIKINQIHWDRCYFDPHSRRKDFSDSKYFGITLWMDTEDAKDMFPDFKESIDGMFSREGTTFEDRPSFWIDSKRDRLRVNQEYFLDKGVWMEVFYSGDTVFKRKKSPYKDENGDPTNPIELQCDFVDRDNNRYGYTERLVDVQDEINHRRSKALHMLSSKSIIAEAGATLGKSPEEILDEVRKAQSYVEIDREARFEIDSQQDMGQSQLGFYQDAQNAMDSVGINPELTGNTESAISGRAFLARQQGGMVELARIFSRHSEWKRRIYRQVWSRMKQFWTDEKWVRVTGEEDVMRFVGLNIPVTRIEKLLEAQTGQDIDDIRSQAGDQLDAFIQQAIQRDPSMGEAVETRNDVAKLHMDIEIEEAPDTISLQQEQFDTLAQLAGTRGDPQMFQALLMLSSLSKKDEVIQLLQGDPQAQQAQAEAQEQDRQIQQALVGVEIENKQAETLNTNADTNLKEAQTRDEIASAMERISKASVVGLPAR